MADQDPPASQDEWLSRLMEPAEAELWHGCLILTNCGSVIFHRFNETPGGTEEDGGVA